MSYWRPGKELKNGKYLVEKLLGGGGFGVTYKIIEQPSEKIFALKTLNYQIQLQENFAQLQEKFINEAIALASCRHPHIVRVYPQVFQEEGLWCMVMEYIEGDDLGVHLETQGRFSEAEALEIVTKIGSALTYVHRQGFLHRDIKPTNILLRKEDNSPVLIDFGSAREYTPGKFATMTNAISECFAPIEQYNRQGNFGAWTDVYALAATLYVLVTAELPIPAQFRAQAPLVPPQEYNPNLSNRINQAIIKGMEVEPEDRPQTVAQWLKLLESVEPKPQDVIPHQQVEQEHSKQDNLNNNLTVTRRRWLKYASLTGMGALGVTLIGKTILSSKLINPFPDNDALKFEVVTVNNQGKAIARRQSRAKYFREDLADGVTIDMVAIPKGVFMMGTEDEEIARLVKKYHWEGFTREQPQHRVIVPAFHMGKFPVTQEQWRVVSGWEAVDRKLDLDPSEFKQNYEGIDRWTRPIEQVSWEDAQEFCQRLSKATGKRYRLPTEAEWEYACRSVISDQLSVNSKKLTVEEWNKKYHQPFHFGETISPELAGYDGNYTYGQGVKGVSRAETTPVGYFKVANAFGLFDMHGNIWEWCEDNWHENYEGAPTDGSAWLSGNSKVKVKRGGSWFNHPRSSRSAFRSKAVRHSRFSNLGFRVVCVTS